MDHSPISSFDFDNDNVYQILDLINSSIYWRDIEGRVLGCNKYALDLFGFKSRADIIGKNEYDVLSKEEADKIRAVDELVLENGYYEGEEEIIIPGNIEAKVFKITKIRLIDKSCKVIMLGNSVDITETKKQMELEKQQAVLDEYAKTLQIIDFVEASIFWRDTDGRILGCNQYVLDLFGVRDRSEIIGKNEYAFLPLDEAKKITHSDEIAFETGFYKGEDHLTLRHNNKKIVMLTSKKPLLDKDGTIVGSIGVSIDITAQKEQQRLQEELLALENKVYKATIERQIAFRKIMEQVMHDIRSPLMIIDGIAGDKNSGLSESYRVQLRNCYQGIVRSANYVMAKFEDINAVDEKAQPLAISVILKQIVNEKGYEYALKPHIVFDYEDKTPDIATSGANFSDFAFMLVQPTPFKRMMSNLINNAVDALAGMTSGKVTVSLCVEEEFIEISVSDNGRGMTREQINKIESGISFTEGKENGHGIGMTQIRETIANNDGTLSICSTNGGESSGSSFILKFPRIEKPDWVVDQIEVSAGDTIVIVDDDHRIHEVWDKQFATVTAKSPMIEIKHFTKGIDAINAIKGLSAEEKAKIYLFSDFSLIGEKKLDNADESLNGVDVIKECGCGRSALVTYFCGDPEIHDMIVNNNTGFLPKGLLKMVTVRLNG